MPKIFLVSLALIKIIISVQSSNRCAFSECNNEGQCSRNDNNKIMCSCIGVKYFKGQKCSEPVNNCQNDNDNLCQNGGQCKAVVGQFICEDCNDGFGGQWCDLEVSRVFQNILLYFNHYGFYGEKHKFLILVETLGEKAFSLEFVSDRYAIDSFETMPDKSENWIYSQDLASVIKTLDIRYYQDLPYSKGYYHIASETFWDIGQLELNLQSYDMESATQLYYQRQFDLLILNRKDEQCVPLTSFIYGLNPVEPLMVDIASYNIFEIILKKRCFPESHIIFKWSIYNSIGTVKLHDFGTTTEFLLKIRPYKLWFNYHSEVMSSYRLVVEMVEEFRYNKLTAEARCFILVLPKPVFASIKGGNDRKIGFKQDLILDASSSRDFALAPNDLQKLIYKWDCVSKGDPNVSYCQENMGFSSVFKMKSGKLKVDKTYNFTLTIMSKVNRLVSDQTFQLVKIMEDSQLSIEMKCLKNCKRNEFVVGEILHLKAETLDTKFTKSASFKWTLQESVVSESQHLVYRTQEMNDVLNIQIVVQDDLKTGTVRKSFKVNTPPLNGTCFVDPVLGEAFLTDFHVKCQDYVDQDTPLNYEYSIENGFPLQRTSEGEIFTKLPETNEIIIKICDQFQACAVNKLKVKVKALMDIKDLRVFLKKKEVDLSNYLKTGRTVTAMILLKSLTKFVNNLKDVSVIVEAISDLKLQTLLQVEQFLEISHNLIQNNLPLSTDKASVFNRLLLQLKQGLNRVHTDEEIFSFSRLSYEKSSLDLLKTMQLFAKIWEFIPNVQTVVPQQILAANALVETYSVLPDFDINILQHLQNWLNSSRNLHDCFNFMAMGAKKLYRPWEEMLSITNNNFNLQIYAFDNQTLQDIQINNGSIEIIVNKFCAAELQEKLQSREIMLQIASLDSNPFWWYPSERPLSTEVFFFSAFGRKSSKTLKYLKYPFEFQLNLKSDTFKLNKISAVLKSSLHMPLYSIELPANALIVVTFTQILKPIKFLLKINQTPRSFDVLQSGYSINSLNLNQNFIFINPFNKKSLALLAVTLESTNNRLSNITFSFQTEIRECLYWDFSLKEPQWSSKACKPKIVMTNTGNNSLTCLCHHFSTFAGRSFQAIVQEDLKQNILVKQLNLSWYLLGFHLSLTFICVFVLYCNFNYHKIWGAVLRLNSTDSLNKDLEIQIFTDSHWNASTTANITLTLLCQKGLYSLTLYQNPKSPFLKRNSISKFMLSSQNDCLPSKLIISNDLAGRYPTWYCHKIIILNLKTLQKQVFLINQWISQQSLEVLETNSYYQSFKHRFRDQLSKFYMNWFQFQPLWGCWEYCDLNRFERSCIFVNQLVSTVCLVSVYFGCTTMETYEEERDLYYYFNFNILELFLLSIICYAINLIIKFIFCKGFWLFVILFVKKYMYFNRK